MQIYTMEVVAIGEDAGRLLEAGVIITFISGAPPELAAFALLVEPGESHVPLQPGDVLDIDGMAFPILAVGDIANKNLRDLAHAVFMFDGKAKAEMPGEVHLTRTALPPISVGSRLAVTRPWGASEKP